MDYQILVTWSAEDGAFVATVPDLPGCMAHGQSEREAIKSAQQAIALYVRDLEDQQEPLPQASRYHLVPLRQVR